MFLCVMVVGIYNIFYCKPARFLGIDIVYILFFGGARITNGAMKVNMFNALDPLREYCMYRNKAGLLPNFLCVFQ